MESGVVDYFLTSKAIVDEAVNNQGGILTTTSRGSAASFITNKLLGLTTVDRFNADVPVYPERFLTKERVLASQMPDIDLNVATQEPFVRAAKKLAGEHGCYPLMAVEKLKEINNLSSNLLSIGQKLKITSNINSGKNTYIVQKGDTLYAIASKFNMTVEQLKKINSLTSNSLSIGQKLIVDGNTNTYTVKKGDTLYGIANKNNTTVNKIKEINNLNSNSLSIGQTLYLP